MSLFIPGLTRKCVVPASISWTHEARPKLVFPDIDAAIDFISRQKFYKQPPLSAYYCEEHKGYHLGHRHNREAA